MTPDSVSGKVIIHHISDLHFGKRLEPTEAGLSQTQEPETYRTEAYVRFLRQNTAVRPHILIVSGDISSVGSLPECKDAATFLRDAAQFLKGNGNRDKRILVVPGNHDVDWFRIKPEKQISPTRLSNFKTATKDFITPFSRRPFIQLRHPPLLIYGLNSVALGGMFLEKPEVQKIRRAINSLKGKLSKQQRKQIFADLEELIAESRIDPGHVSQRELRRLDQQLDALAKTTHIIRLAVVHHNITSFPAPEFRAFDIPINAGRIKKRLLDNGFQVLLHGHKHTFQILEERDIQRTQSLFIISAGTLSSYGESSSFNEIIISAHSPIIEIREIRWHRDEFVRSTERAVALPLSERPELRDDFDAILAKFSPHHSLGKILRDLRQLAGRDAAELREALDEISLGLDARKVGLAGVNDRFVANMKTWLKQPDTSKVFFIDVLGPAAWSHATFATHMAHQIRHYLKNNYRAPQSWRLNFSVPLRSAILKCIRNASKLHQYRQDPSLDPAQFGRLTESKVRKDLTKRARYEIARILLWKPRDLLTVRGRALIHVHKVFKIPLFFLDPADLGQRDRRFKNIEYHFFAREERKRGWVFVRGRFYDKKDPAHVRQEIDETGGIPGLGLPVSHFTRLLDHPKLLLAYDKYMDLKYGPN